EVRGQAAAHHVAKRPGRAAFEEYDAMLADTPRPTLQEHPGAGLRSRQQQALPLLVDVLDKRGPGLGPGALLGVHATAGDPQRHRRLQQAIGFARSPQHVALAVDQDPRSAIGGTRLLREFPDGQRDDLEGRLGRCGRFNCFLPRIRRGRRLGPLRYAHPTTPITGRYVAHNARGRACPPAPLITTFTYWFHY